MANIEDPTGGQAAHEADEPGSVAMARREENVYSNPNNGFAALINNRQLPVPAHSSGIDYAKFYEAFGFGQSLAAPQVGSSPNVTAPAQRPAAGRKSTSRKTTPGYHRIIPSSDPKPSSASPSKRPASSAFEASKRVKMDPPGSLHQTDYREATPNGTVRLTQKGHATQVKGSGIYRKGNWAWVSDEEDGGKVDEKILHEAQQISSLAESSADAPVKMTRRQLHDLKAKINGSSPATTPGPSRKPSIQGHLSNSTRPSRRASRVAPNYSTSNEVEDDGEEPTLRPNLPSPSTLESPFSHGSTPTVSQPSRSTTASTVPHQPEPNREHLTRPKLSWNAVVYEVFANSTIPEMTLTEVQQGIKERFPFYARPENEKVVESSPRNPLYMHPQFYKTVRGDGKIAWGLKPGDFVDKKTGKVLNAGASRAVRPVESKELSTKAAQQDAVGTPLSPRLPTTPASNGVIGQASSPSDVKQISQYGGRGESLHDTPRVMKGLSPDLGQHEEITSQASSISSAEEVPETQLPQEVPETQLPPSSPQEVMETQPPGVEQISGATVLESREQRRLEGIVHKNLTETFRPEEMNSFIQQTKLWYFKNMVLTGQDVDWILGNMPLSRNNPSTDADMAACARELQSDYEHRIWASEWFLKFVNDNVAQFDEMNIGFLKYSDLTKPIRLNFWLARSIWNHDTCARIFAPLSDAIDVEKLWTIKHWHDFVEKLYTTACDAICDLRGQEHVFREIKVALQDRYPERNTWVWNVPAVLEWEGTGWYEPKASVAKSEAGSAGESVD